MFRRDPRDIPDPKVELIPLNELPPPRPEIVASWKRPSKYSTSDPEHPVFSLSEPCYWIFVEERYGFADGWFPRDDLDMGTDYEECRMIAHGWRREILWHFRYHTSIEFFLVPESEIFEIPREFWLTTVIPPPDLGELSWLINRKGTPIP